MMSENKDTESITKGEGGSSSTPAPRLGRSDSSASTGSQRSYSQRFSLGTPQPYLVPDERVLQLKDRKLLTDIMFDELVNVCWLLDITPKSTPIVDRASCYTRSLLCVPGYLMSRGLTILTCFISDSCPGTVSRFTHEHCTEDLLAYIRTQVEKRKISAPVVAAAVYYAMITRPPSFMYAADTESLIMEKVEVVLQEGRDAGAKVDEVMAKMNERLVNQHFMVPPAPPAVITRRPSRTGNV